MGLCWLGPPADLECWQGGKQRSTSSPHDAPIHTHASNIYSQEPPSPQGPNFFSDHPPTAVPCGIPRGLSSLSENVKGRWGVAESRCQDLGQGQETSGAGAPSPGLSLEGGGRRDPPRAPGSPRPPAEWGAARSRSPPGPCHPPRTNPPRPRPWPASRWRAGGASDWPAPGAWRSGRRPGRRAPPASAFPRALRPAPRATRARAPARARAPRAAPAPAPATRAAPAPAPAPATRARPPWQRARPQPPRPRPRRAARAPAAVSPERGARVPGRTGGPGTRNALLALAGAGGCGLLGTLSLGDVGRLPQAARSRRPVRGGHRSGRGPLCGRCPERRHRRLLPRRAPTWAPGGRGRGPLLPGLWVGRGPSAGALRSLPRRPGAGLPQSSPGVAAAEARRWGWGSGEGREGAGDPAGTRLSSWGLARLRP